MDDLKTEIENLENLISSADTPTTTDEWDSLRQEIEDYICNIKNEVDSCEKEIDEMKDAIGEAEDKLYSISKIAIDWWTTNTCINLRLFKEKTIYVVLLKGAFFLSPYLLTIICI